jgi:hypothetical protein
MSKTAVKSRIRIALMVLAIALVGGAGQNQVVAHGLAPRQAEPPRPMAAADNVPQTLGNVPPPCLTQSEYERKRFFVEAARIILH